SESWYGGVWPENDLLLESSQPAFLFGSHCREPRCFWAPFCLCVLARHLQLTCAYGSGPRHTTVWMARCLVIGGPRALSQAQDRVRVAQSHYRHRLSKGMVWPALRESTYTLVIICPLLLFQPKFKNILIES
ncbi:hypothetical protein H1C71_011985, partial [Ictidomys tridecemlineatus]